jgi:hypothetical protein
VFSARGSVANHDGDEASTVDEVEIVVDGERFTVRSRAPQAGYSFDWTNGPCEQYGFSQSSGDNKSLSVRELTAVIEDFLKAFYSPGHRPAIDRE